MDNSTDANSAPAGIFSPNRIGRLGYSVGISVGFLLLITTITLMSYFCTRPAANEARRRRHIDHDEEMAEADDDVEAGLDEATLTSYPKMAYSRAKLRDPNTVASCCSICLADYKDAEVLRVLPECGHVFHLKCVDPWLRLRPTCPVCRSSPMPSPLPTPLAEVVPLAVANRSL